MKILKPEYCNGKCSQCWPVLDWKHLSLGLFCWLIAAIGVVHLLQHWERLFFFDAVMALVMILAVLIIRARLSTARLVTFFLSSDSIVENIGALLLFTVFPGLGEFMFLTSGKTRATVRPFLVPHFDLSAFEVALELRERGVFAKIISDNTLTVYMDKRRIKVQINEENHSICVDGEYVPICILDDAGDLARKIIGEDTYEDIMQG